MSGPDLPFEMPPTMDELPYDDGEPMETQKHRDQMNLLCDVLECHYHDRPDVFVAGNMALYYSLTQARNLDFRAPDVFVVLDALPGRERKSWVVWEEDGRLPDVVIELLSASTEREDRGRKKDIYARLGVRAYYLFDPVGLAFEGYRLTPARTYERMEPLPGGDLPVPPLGLRLGLAEGFYRRRTTMWLRWKAPDGTVLPSESEIAAQAKARADEAKARADEAKARADEAKARADEAKARADEAKARADEEHARAERLAARLRALGVDPDDPAVG